MDDLFCEQLRLRFSYDPDTGLIHSRLRFDKNGSPAVVGHVNQRGYMALCTMGKSVVSHRVAWLLTHGYWPSPKLDVDHINGNKSDNRLANLRLVSRVENSQNRHMVSRKKANKLIGAYFIGNREKPWRAAIKVMGKLMNLGQFATEQEAHAVYLDAKRIYHPAPTPGATQALLVRRFCFSNKEIEMTETTAKALAVKLMAWELPQDFLPDCFISFDRERATANGSWPVGTNLLTVAQAEQMFAYVLEGSPHAQAPELLADLRAAAALLRKYEGFHRAKDTEESDAKAEVNAAMAARFEATIAKATE